MTMYISIPQSAMAHDFAHCEWDMPVDFKGMGDMYRKEDAQAAHGCDAVYCEDLSDDAAFFGSVDTTDNDAFPFPVVDFSSSECATPTPMPEHLADPAQGQVPAEDYGDDRMPRAANRMCGEAMQALPPVAPLGSRPDKTADATNFADCNNPYAKPRITFRNGGPSPRAVRPVAHPQMQAPAEAFVAGGSHQQQQPHSSPAAARPRVKAASRPVVPSNKLSKVCFYELCPSPMQSNKWRTVTEGTAAGGQIWDPLVGKMLCDSCYSTFRKHGTLVRSVRTAEGWARLDNEGTVHRPNHPKSGRAKRPAPSASASAAAEGSPKQRKRAAPLRAPYLSEADSHGRPAGPASPLLHSAGDAYSEGMCAADDESATTEERHDDQDDFCSPLCASHEQWHSSTCSAESVTAL